MVYKTSMFIMMGLALCSSQKLSQLMVKGFAHFRLLSHHSTTTLVARKEPIPEPSPGIKLRSACIVPLKLGYTGQLGGVRRENTEELPCRPSLTETHVRISSAPTNTTLHFPVHTRVQGFDQLAMWESCGSWFPMPAPTKRRTTSHDARTRCSKIRNRKQMNLNKLCKSRTNMHTRSDNPVSHKQNINPRPNSAINTNDIILRNRQSYSTTSKKLIITRSKKNPHIIKIAIFVSTNKALRMR